MSSTAAASLEVRAVDETRRGVLTALPPSPTLLGLSRHWELVSRRRPRLSLAQREPRERKPLPPSPTLLGRRRHWELVSRRRPRLRLAQRERRERKPPPPGQLLRPLRGRARARSRGRSPRARARPEGQGSSRLRAPRSARTRRLRGLRVLSRLWTRRLGKGQAGGPGLRGPPAATAARGSPGGQRRRTRRARPSVPGRLQGERRRLAGRPAHSEPGSKLRPRCGGKHLKVSASLQAW